MTQIHNSGQLTEKLQILDTELISKMFSDVFHLFFHQITVDTVNTISTCTGSIANQDTK